jgi:beta-N-acetylhexosaminidase
VSEGPNRPEDDLWFEDEPAAGEAPATPAQPAAPEPAATPAEPAAEEPAAPPAEPAAAAPTPPRRRRRPPRPSLPREIARRRVIAAGVLLALVAGGAGVLALTSDDGDPAPVGEAGSRFGAGDGEQGGGSLLDALAPVLGTQAPRRRGAEPAPPTAKELGASPADAVAGLLVVGFRGTRTDNAFFRRLRVRPYGGILMGSINYASTTQMQGLTAHAQLEARKAGHPAPLIAAGQEGGELNAFPGPPRSQAVLGDAGVPSVRRDAGRAARRLRALGVGITLAPSADLAVAGGPAQGRAFADSPGAVARSTRAAVGAYRRAGVAAAIGHFPGEGAAAQDPSAGPAPVGLSLEQLRASDMKPFEALARGRSAAPAIQMSNAIYAAYDSVTPATLLPAAVDELRRRLGFQGVIVSGALDAATATTGGTVGAAAVQALKAGVDLLLIPGGRAQQDEAFRTVVSAVRRGVVPAKRVEEALKRVAALRRATRRTRRTRPAASIAPVPTAPGLPPGP